MPVAIENWIKWHSKNSKEIIDEFFRDNDAKYLVLSFRFRSALEENVTSLGRYLKAVSEYQTSIEPFICKGSNNGKFYDLNGFTDQGVIDKERLLGWVNYMIEVGHEFGCWLQCWEVVNDPHA